MESECNDIAHSRTKCVLVMSSVCPFTLIACNNIINFDSLIACNMSHWDLLQPISESKFIIIYFFKLCQFEKVNNYNGIDLEKYCSTIPGSWLWKNSFQRANDRIRTWPLSTPDAWPGPVSVIVRKLAVLNVALWGCTGFKCFTVRRGNSYFTAFSENGRCNWRLDQRVLLV